MNARSPVRVSIPRLYQEVPLPQERERFLAHLERQGATFDDLKSTETYLSHIASGLHLDTRRPIELDEIEKAGRYWATYQSGHVMKEERVEVGRRFVHVACSWLQFEGLFVTSPAHRAYTWTTEYREEIRSHARLASITVETYAARIESFLGWFFSLPEHRPFIVLKDVDTYVGSRLAEGWKLQTIPSVCHTLRNFLAFAETRGWCERGLKNRVKSPRFSKYYAGNKGPHWPEVRRILRSVRGAEPVELRANAVLRVLAIYGLRSSEVCRLKISDFDWRNEVFTVERSKRGGIQRFPIQYEVGKAILKYLQDGRPSTSCPALFVTAYRPYRPLGGTAIWQIVAPRMKALGIESAHIGPHCLRHACAMRLLNRGMSLKEIADFLGHRDPLSVAIYARHDTRSLKKVAAISLAGLYR